MIIWQHIGQCTEFYSFILSWHWWANGTEFS